MKSSIVNSPYIKDPENYTDLKVCQSGAGYYIGTMYKDPEMGGMEVPGSRDSGYYPTHEAAQKDLDLLLAGDENAPTLRQHP